MEEMSYYNLNGKLIKSSENHLSINNRSFRYGEGFFETIKVKNGIIQLKELHFERIQKSLLLLKLHLPKNFYINQIEQEILTTLQKNKQNNLARVRINFFRSEGELFDATNHQTQILIQSFEINEAFKELNNNGLVIDIFPDAKKSCDSFSNIKSNNFLPYTMGAIWAKENKFNDAIILNTNNNIADSCIANVFIIKDNIIYTPGLNDACVDGVMRKHIITHLKINSIEVLEKSLTANDLENADEVFLTNAIRRIQWVSEFRNKQFTNTYIQKINALIFNSLI